MHCIDADGFTSLLQDIPLHALKSELARRVESRASGGEEDGSTCGSEKAGYYNTPAHVFALLLILILSTLGKSINRLGYASNVSTNRLSHSMLIPNSSASISWITHPTTFPLLLQTFRHRRSYSYGVRPFTSYRFQFAIKFMSPAVLDSRVPGNGRVYSNALGIFGCHG